MLLTSLLNYAIVLTETQTTQTEVMIMRTRVHFIGSGYESVKFVIVEAETEREAIEKAQTWYKETNQSFSYCEIECDRFPV